MTFRFLWNVTARGISMRLNTSVWNAHLTHKLKWEIKTGIATYAKREWGSQRLLRRIKHTLDRHGRKFILFSATGIYNASEDKNKAFNWSESNVKNEEFQELSNEMTELEALKMATIVCGECKKRLLIDKPVGNKDYCRCENNKAIVDPLSGWEPFLESGDIIIWRRVQNPGEGLYAYKIYGCYREIRADDFLAMHIDTDYWRSWDTSALSVRTLEKQNDVYGGQCVIHWEMLWPKFFANRDYVYVRRYAHLNKRHCENQFKMNEKDDDLIVVASRSCEHPNAPETKSAFRVKQYWSNLVIKPIKEVNKPGIEFSLTYFDDPGANIPSALQSWVAGQGMPDYLARMRSAAAKYRETTKEVKSVIIDFKNIPSFESPESVNVDDLFSNMKSDEKSTEDGNNSETDEFLNLIDARDDFESDRSDDLTEDADESDKNQNEVLEKVSNQSQANNYNYWHLWPLYYFA